MIGTRDMDGQARLFVERESASGLYQLLTDRVDLGADEATVESAGLTTTNQGLALVWNSLVLARHQLQESTNGPANGWATVGPVFTTQQARVERLVTNIPPPSTHYRLLWLK